LFYRKTKIFEFILDETQIKVGSELIWLWVAIEPESKEVLRLNIYIKRERNMFVAERFLSSVIKEYMENIQFLPMAVPGIHKPVNS
jgi:putative transposase